MCPGIVLLDLRSGFLPFGFALKADFGEVGSCIEAFGEADGSRGPINCNFHDQNRHIKLDKYNRVN